MKTQHQLYRELEQIPDAYPLTHTTHPQFKINLVSLGRLIAKIFENNHDPKITTFKTHRGELRWRVYNPKNGMTAIFHSPDEILIWLEERYYKEP